MPRTARKHADGHWYHVWNRGARRLPVFNDERDRRLFLWLLGHVSERFGLEVHAYCLLGNHYHLVVRCPDGNLDECMHYLGTIYTQRFNRRYRLDGPLFRGRFGSRPILDDSDLLGTVRYVVLNPVKHGLTSHATDHPWSSHHSYLAPRPREPWLVTSVVLAMFNRSPEQYRAFIDDGIGDARRRARHKPKPRECSIELIEDVALEVVGGSRCELSSWGRGQRVPARLLVLLLATEVGRTTASDLAARYGAAGAATIRSAVARARRRLAADPQFASWHCAALSRLDFE